jgi:hypothetical protein
MLLLQTAKLMVETAFDICPTTTDRYFDDLQLLALFKPKPKRSAPKKRSKP